MTDYASLIANPALTAEEFDGETVLLDVEHGLYFSLRGAATELWRLFGRARKPADALDILCSRLADADRRALEDSIQGMRDNRILVPSAESPDEDREPVTISAAEFAMPTVEAFSDLADLIAIDPVHEVNPATGWPVRPGNFPDVE